MIGFKNAWICSKLITFLTDMGFAPRAELGWCLVWRWCGEELGVEWWGFGKVSPGLLGLV